MTWRNIKIRSKLLIAFLGLSGFFVAAFYLINIEFQKKGEEQLVASKIKVSQVRFKSQEDSDTRMLSSLLNVIVQDSDIKQQYLAKDREKLYAYIEPLFKNLDEKYSVTHWYFILPDGTVFLRAHSKALYGDVVARKTFLAARDTKQVASGLELGKTAYALRVVMPYYDNGELIGYVELGEEISHFLTGLESESGDKFSVFADKSRLSHVDWQSTREKAGLADNWDEYSNQLPVSSTPGSELTWECLAGQKVLSKYLVVGNQTFACAGFELITAGREPGGMIVSLVNISEYAALIKNNNFKILTWVIILLFCASGAGLLIALSIANPINRLSRAAKEIASGDLTRRITVSSTDEIGQLATLLNEMMDRLQQFHQVLEKKVEERTRELGNSVEALKSANRSAEESRMAMINLLEDEKELEKQLADEKAGVETKVEERTREVKEAHEKISEGWLQLQEEKARLSASINNLPVGFVMTDITENVLVMNETAKKILGTEGGEKTLGGIGEILEGKVNLHEFHQKCGVEKRRIDIKEVMVGSKYLHVFLSPILTGGPDSECIGVVILIEDVTEEKVLGRSKDEFFSIASHELRTPLTAIRGNTDLILQFYGDQIKDPQFKEMVDDVHESAVRLIDIVNDFLDMSRLEMGKMEFKKDDLDMGLVVAETLKEYQVTGSRKKLSLEFVKPEGGTLWAVGDRDKVKQVLINLIGNGLKFTEEGGVTIGLSMKGKTVKAAVTDTGRGVPKKNQSLLFRKFQQAGSSIYTRDVVQGTGLGLYISKLLVEGMGGTIALEKSEVGKGSTFVFSLPVAEVKDES